MAAHFFAFPSSTDLEPTVGILTTELVPPLQNTGHRRVSVCLPQTSLERLRPDQPAELDWMDFILSGSSDTPTGGLAVLLDDVALYFLFNLRDGATRKLLEVACRQRCIDLVYANAVVTLKERLLFRTLCEHKTKVGTEASPRAWFEHAAQLLPGLPTVCSLRLPSMMGARKHIAVLVASEATARALRDTRRAAA